MKGLSLFKDRFSRFAENYVLIGGAACTLAMEERGFLFRKTVDLDIVLSVEALNANFVKAFWDFIREGEYQYRQKSTGKKLFYRFYGPKDTSYPEMLELFSRKPDAIPLQKGPHLTPVPVNEEVSSLSAILLNDDYYQFIHQGKQEIEGLPIVAPAHLIPLKARAWVDLSSQKSLRGHIDESDIRKHRNDVIRLYQLIAPDARVFLPKSIQQDMQAFLEGIEKVPVDVKQLGVKSSSFTQILIVLRQVYGL